MSTGTKNMDDNNVHGKFRYNNVGQSGKCIIEEWQNSSKLDENVLRSDELYKERAIDVVIDYHPHQTRAERSNSRMDINENHNHTVKMRDENSGTVRSIPIKNYQTSLVHNIGTIRRSEAPQLQFESSVSEPERNLYMSIKHKTTSTNNPSFISHQETEHAHQISQRGRTQNNIQTKNPPRRSCHSCEYQRELQAGNHRENSRVETMDRRISKSERHDLMNEENQRCSDYDDYFRRSSRRLNSGRQSKGGTRCKNKPDNGNIEETRKKNVEDDKHATRVDFERGNVGQKICAYEENARRSGRNWEANCQLASELKKHRAVGIPLVGMHNACGLPIVASWHEHQILEPLRFRNKGIATLKPSFKGSRSPHAAHRRRTYPKRKAPQPNENLKKNHATNSKNINSVNRKLIKKNNRRPSFRAVKVGTFSTRNSLKRVNRSESRRHSLMNSFGRRSLNNGSSKRRTLYARDDGEEAVKVLKGLCLNPLARTKSGADMIW